MSETIGQSKRLLGVEVSSTKLHSVCLEIGTNVGNYDSQELNKDAEVLPQLIEFIKEQQTKFGQFAKIGVRDSKSFEQGFPLRWQFDFETRDMGRSDVNHAIFISRTSRTLRSKDFEFSNFVPARKSAEIASQSFGSISSNFCELSLGAGI